MYKKTVITTLELTSGAGFFRSSWFSLSSSSSSLLSVSVCSLDSSSLELSDASFSAATSPSPAFLPAADGCLVLTRRPSSLLPDSEADSASLWTSPSSSSSSSDADSSPDELLPLDDSSAQQEECVAARSTSKKHRVVS